MTRRSDEGFGKLIFETLMLAPVWVGPILAGLAYAGLRFLWPRLSAGDQPATKMLGSIGPAIAPWIAAFILVIWVAAELQKRHRRRLLDRQTGIESIRQLEWQEFERLVGEAYRRQGFAVEECGGSSGDGGVDLVLCSRGRRVLVQCKQWKAWKVGVPPVRELYGVMTSERASEGILVTSGRFTDEAKAFAAGKPMTLVEGQELCTLIESVRQRGGAGESTAAARAASSAPEKQPAGVSAAAACPACGSPMILRTAKRGASAGSQFWGCTRYPACRGTRPA